MWDKSNEEYDAYITNTPDINILVTTADCIPAILYDTVQNVVAVIHSGWKGTLNEIIPKTLNKMISDFNTEPSNVLAVFGPSIGSCCFTTEDKEFVYQFKEICENETKYYTKIWEVYHIDLEKLIKLKLTKFGINPKNIYSANICTKCNRQDFYSYRASENKFKYGTFAAIVGLK